MFDENKVNLIFNNFLKIKIVKNNTLLVTFVSFYGKSKKITFDITSQFGQCENFSFGPYAIIYHGFTVNEG